MTANVSDLLLGKGKVFVDVLVNDVSTGEFDLGNCTAFSVQTAVEKTEKRSSMTADGGLLAVIPKFTTTTLKIVGDYFNKDNMGLALLSNEITKTVAASTITDATLTASAVLGRFYKIPANGVLSAIVVKVGASVIADAASNYIVDSKTNRILIVGGDIDAGDTVTVSATIAAGTVKVLAGATAKRIIALVRFVSDNTTGENKHVVAHRVDITPDAEVGFITDDLASWSLAGSVLNSADIDPASPYFTVYTI